MLWRLVRPHVFERSGYVYDAFRYVIITRAAKIQSAQICRLQVFLNSSCKVLGGLLRKSVFDSAIEVTSNCRISDESVC